MPTTTKTKQNTKQAPRRKHWLLIIILVVLVGTGVAVFASKTWITHAYYGHKAMTALADQTKKLSGSLAMLGLKPTAKVSSTCTNEMIYGYQTSQLQCTAERQNYVVVGTDATSIAAFVAKARELDTLLKSNGWVTTSNSATTVGEWFAGITSGKDYSTDIDSVRNGDGTHCSLVFNVAYSNPKPPAFQIRMSCSTPVLDKIKNDATL